MNIMLVLGHDGAGVTPESNQMDESGTYWGGVRGKRSIFDFVLAILQQYFI